MEGALVQDTGAKFDSADWYEVQQPLEPSSKGMVGVAPYVFLVSLVSKTRTQEIVRQQLPERSSKVLWKELCSSQGP